MRALRIRPWWLPLVGLAFTGCDGCSKPEGAIADAAPVATTIPDAAPLTATPLPVASVAAMVNPDGLPAYAGPTGSVEGTISVIGDPAPETTADYRLCPDGAKIYGHAFREGEPSEPGGPRWLADAVVAITGYSGFYVQEKDEAEEATIEGCGFSRRTITMTFGQRLEVKNLTKDLWTPKLDPSPPTVSAVMRMATPNGDPVKLYPRKPGRYRLIDHDRKFAVSDLYTFLHPLHTSSALQGTYRIDGIPVGKVVVNSTHPRIANSEASKEIEIREGVVARVDLTLEHKKTESPAPSPDAGSVRLR